MKRPRRQDAGTTHVLEAVIVASIMLSAIAFVSTFEDPPASSNPTRPLLETRAKDVLALLADTPVSGSSFGDNLLSVYLAQCLQGNCTNMTNKFSKILPQGASYALYVSNGYDTYPVYVTRSPPGESVVASQVLEPHWSYTFTGNGLSVVNNKTDPLTTYALPVYNSNVLWPGGSPLKVTVKGHKESDGSSYTLESFYTTQAIDTAHAGQFPAVSLNFLANRSSWPTGSTPLGGFYPSAFYPRTPETMESSGRFPSNASVPFHIQIKESAGVAIPAGAQITVNIPRGWNASGWENETWMIEKNATSWNGTYNGSDVVATLRSSIAGGSTVNFDFNATYHGDLLTYYPFRASLSRGVNAEANMIVQADTWPDNTQTFAVPRVVASVPRPMGATATTTWSLAVNIPYNPTGSFVVSKSTLMSPPIPTNTPQTIVSGTGVSGTGTPSLHTNAGSTGQSTTTIVIENITIEEQNGAKIFGAVTPSTKVGGIGTPTSYNGQWTSYGNKLVWTGQHRTIRDGTLNLTFDVTGAGIAGAAAPKIQVLPPIEYNNMTGRLLAQTGPGLYRDAFLPNNTTASYYAGVGGSWLGYDSSPVSDTVPLKYNYTTDAIYRATKLLGHGNYTVNAASPLTDALYGSYVAANKRSVPVGGQVIISADVQSMLYALSAAGQSAGVNLTFYPPWAGDQRIPIWSLQNLDSGILTSSVVQLAMLDLNGDGYPDPIVGTDQGRVLAFDGLTGERVQGSTWVAPLVAGQNGVASIRQLKTITLGGVDYIVVGCDGKSSTYILDKGFNAVWTWTKEVDLQTQGVVSMDTAKDVDGDGRRDVVVAMDDASIFVLRAPAGQSALTPYVPTNGPLSPTFAYAKSTGTPAAVAALDGIGAGNDHAVAVSMVSMPGAGVSYHYSGDHPEQPPAVNPQLTAKSPRAGMNVYDNLGQTRYSFIDTPVTQIRTTDFDNDGRTDIIAGSSAGYVYMLNGTRATPPAPSNLWTPPLQIMDGDARDPAHAAWVSKDGTVAFTYDGFNFHNCVACDPNSQSGAQFAAINGIALNSSMGIWLAGDAGQLWRAVDSGSPGYPWMALMPINATKNGAAYTFGALGALHNLEDVHFFWGANGNKGFVVGSPDLISCLLQPLGLQPYCDESLVMTTTDGGANWRVLSAGDLVAATGTLLDAAGTGHVKANLTRVNFTTDQIGWAIGKAGTLLRTQDGGVHWRQLTVPTTADLKDISCAQADPNVCFLVGTGVVFRTVYSQNASFTGLTAPYWQNITGNVSSIDLTQRTLGAAGVVNKSVAYIAADNAILQTYDGGNNWTSIPNGFVSANVNRMSIFPDGNGYFWGGNLTAARQWSLSSYLASARVTTLDLTDLDLVRGALPVGATIYEANASIGYAKPQDGSTTISVAITADGSHYHPGDFMLSGTNDTSQNTLTATIATSSYRTNFTGGNFASCAADCGRDLRLQIDLANAPDSPFLSPYIESIGVVVKYKDPNTLTNGLRWYNLSIADAAKKDTAASATTAIWDTDWGAIHLPFAGKFWTRNVSGQVLDIQTGANVSGDSHPEIWVGTGGIVAENSPDYQAFAGVNPDAYVSADNRVYLLDGNNGSIISKTQSYAGNVTKIRLADENGDGTPDYLFVLTYDTAHGGTTYVLYPSNLTPVPDPIAGYFNWTTGDKTPVNALEVGHNATNVSAVLGYGSYPRGTAVDGGGLQNFWVSNTTARKVSWTSKNDERGQYIIAKDIPKNWFFGPYVVEVKVDWQDQVVVGGVQQTIVQSAQYYDYFLVTPPDAVNPPSPLYHVDLVTWMDDWR